jgi:hypothetical protein
VNLAAFVDEAIEYDARPNIRRAMAPDRLEALGREGAAMALDDIVAYALDVPIGELRARTD